MDTEKVFKWEGLKTVGKNISSESELNKEKIEFLKKEIENADAIVIGAGAGLSTSAGCTYSGERFEKYFFTLVVFMKHIAFFENIFQR